MYDKHFIGLDLTGFEDNGVQRPISRVTLLVDDKNVITAGDDTGAELSADCPHATQTMADRILAQVKGYEYRMFSAHDANLDPAAELGDGVTAGSAYSVISRITSDGSGYASVTAPGEAELEDEYPSAGPMTQAFNRQLAQTRSQIIKTAEEITQSVTKEVEGLEGKISLTASSLTSQITNTRDELSSKLEQTASSLTSEIRATNGQVSAISQTVGSIETQVTGLDGNYSSLKQYVDSMTLTVSNGSTSSTVALKAGSTTISSQTINMTGFVTFTGLSSGTTTINGACIKTGTIDAARLNLTGAITFSDLNAATQTKINNAVSTASSAASTAESASQTVQGWCYEGTTEIDGKKIRTGTVEASVLRGGEVQLLNDEGVETGTFGIVKEYFPEGSYFRGAVTIKADTVRLETENSYGRIMLLNGGNALFIDPDGVSVSGGLSPFLPAQYDLGTVIRQWNDLYIANDPIVTSDRNKKKDITYGLTAYDALWDALRPASYRFTDGQSGRTHLGLIAQDVEQALADCALTGMDFAGFVKSPRVDDAGQIVEGEYDYALRYGEFIPLCIHKIQTLTARVAELERRITP